MFSVWLLFLPLELAAAPISLSHPGLQAETYQGPLCHRATPYAGVALKLEFSQPPRECLHFRGTNLNMCTNRPGKEDCCDCSSSGTLGV